MSGFALLCLYCSRELRHDRSRGWIHVDGGGTYAMYCAACGWQGTPYPSPVRCPGCGSREVRDDHCALPDRQEQMA